MAGPKVSNTDKSLEIGWISWKYNTVDPSHSKVTHQKPLNISKFTNTMKTLVLMQSKTNQDNLLSFHKAKSILFFFLRMATVSLLTWNYALIGGKYLL